MKIVYCIAGTYRSGGMERVLALKANRLAAMGHEVTIVTTDQRGREPFFALDPRIATVDLDIGYELNNGASFFSKLLAYPAKQLHHRRRLGRLLDRIDPDVAVSMFCNDATFLYKLHKRSRKVLEIHFSRHKRLQYGRTGLYGLADRLRSGIDLMTVGRYDRFVVLTDEDSALWGDLPNICVIPNPTPIEARQAATLDAKQALAVGRFSHQKSFDRLITAWRKVSALHPDWHLCIAGDGELRPQLEQQIRDAGLTEAVSLIPPVKDVERLYLGSSMYLLSSRYEGLPMVLIEAQSCGLPIVSFACKCGPRDVVTDGVDGFIVDEGDTDALARAVCRLIEDPELRRDMGRRAFSAAARYSADNIMARWATLFNELKNDPQ